jgi:hypothetical protein
MASRELILHLTEEQVQRITADVASRLTVDVEAAMAEGYRRAIDTLRDTERLGAWFKERVRLIEQQYAETGVRPWPPNEQPPSREYADYLEAMAPGADRPKATGGIIVPGSVFIAGEAGPEVG